MNKITVALAGQPNCGKSTIFNLLSGINQHIANYPGVTVDKKVGNFSYDKYSIDLVDLPGTYSFSSFSMEEKVAKDFLLGVEAKDKSEMPDMIINVVDASNLKRNLYLTFQLLEIGIPVVVVLNMMDIAKRRDIDIDVEKISSLLSCPVIKTTGIKGLGSKEILNNIVKVYENKNKYEEFKIDYEQLEPYIETIQNKIVEIDSKVSKRWLAIKLLEEDDAIIKYTQKTVKLIGEDAKECSSKFTDLFEEETGPFLARFRYDSSALICEKAVKAKTKITETITDKIDKIVLNRVLALPVLFLIIFAIYEISIVYGYRITDYTWPLLAGIKNFVIEYCPGAYFTDVPMITSFAMWMVNSTIALLNYLPIFFLLFAMIAILEDVGYMPRMAFILDRIFRKFGLHGQSTLPLCLGGAMVGGCAVPGVMATKGITDDRARMATILSVPYMNCLAKVPFYTLLLGAFFKDQMGIMMIFISSVTIFIALIVSKLLTSTILKTRETTPFVMELPPYHIPTFKGVILKACQRVWVYIKKVMTIVLLVAICLFAMLEYPGVDEKSEKIFEKESTKALNAFYKKVEKNKYYDEIDTKQEVSELLNYYDLYKAKKMSTSSKNAAIELNKEFKNKNLNSFKFIKPIDKDSKKINRLIRKLSKVRKRILRHKKNEKIENSLLGNIGRSITPITQYAGFDWRINVAFLSSFAARESSVATLGSIYEQNKDLNSRPEEGISNAGNYTPLHAVAIIIFMLLTPPCIATMIVIKIQTNSYKWMTFAILFPMILGVIFSSLVFTLGIKFDLTGLEAMQIFYFFIAAIALILGLWPNRVRNWKGGLKMT